MEAFPKHWPQIASQHSAACYILISRLCFYCKFVSCYVFCF